MVEVKVGADTVELLSQDSWDLSTAGGRKKAYAYVVDALLPYVGMQSGDGSFEAADLVLTAIQGIKDEQDSGRA